MQEPALGDSGISVVFGHFEVGNWASCWFGRVSMLTCPGLFVSSSPAALCFAQVFVSNGFPAGTTGYDFLTNIVSIVIIIATVAFVAFGAFAAFNSADDSRPPVHQCTPMCSFPQ